MWIVFATFIILVLISSGAPGYNVVEPSLFNPHKPVRCIVLTLVFLVLGFFAGVVFYQRFDKIWLIPLLTYMSGAIPGMFLMNANCGQNGPEFNLVGAIGRYIVSLFAYPFKTLRCIRGYHYNE